MVLGGDISRKLRDALKPTGRRGWVSSCEGRTWLMEVIVGFKVRSIGTQRVFEGARIGDNVFLDI
jgi:hypothetical protein